MNRTNNPQKLNRHCKSKLYTNSKINCPFYCFKHKIKKRKKSSTYNISTLNASHFKKSKRGKAISSTTSALLKQFTEACALLVNSSLCTKLRNWATVRSNYALHISDYIIQDTKHSNKRHKRMRRQSVRNREAPSSHEAALPQRKINDFECAQLIYDVPTKTTSAQGDKENKNEIYGND